PLAGRGFHQRAPAEIAHVVDQDIYAPETVHHRANKLIGAAGLADVRLHRDAIGAHRLQLTQRQLRGSFVGAIRDGDARAVLCQTQRDAPPNSTATTCDYSDPVPKRHSSPRKTCQYIRLRCAPLLYLKRGLWVSFRFADYPGVGA